MNTIKYIYLNNVKVSFKQVNSNTLRTRVGRYKKKSTR